MAIHQHEGPGLLAKVRENRRFFRWVTASLLFLWLVSVCVTQICQIGIPRYATIEIGIIRGSIMFEVTEARPGAEWFHADPPGFIGSEPSLQALKTAKPLDLAALLAGNGCWSRPGFLHVSIPFLGLLGMWLALACAAEFKARRKDREGKEASPGSTYSPRRLTVLAAITALLGITVPLMAMRGKELNYRTVCFFYQRNIQQAIRSWSGVKGKVIGEPVIWKDIFGPSGFLSAGSRYCPWGDPYDLLPGVPGVGVLAARCHHPGHENLFGGIDTSEW